MERQFFVVVKTTHVEKSSKRGKLELRYRYRLVRAGVNHDKSMTRYMAFRHIDDEPPYRGEIRVLNPYSFPDIDLHWVMAQLAVHVPEVSLAEYHACIVKGGGTQKWMSNIEVAKQAIMGKVYNWAGVEVYIDDEENELW